MPWLPTDPTTARAIPPFAAPGAALTVACPTCRRPPGEPCASRTGKPAQEPHAARRRTARTTPREPTGWTLRIIWPIENPELFNSEAIALARADLPGVAAHTKAVIVGEPTFRVVDCDRSLAWPTTPTAVVCEVEALPAVAPIGHTPTQGRTAA